MSKLNLTNNLRQKSSVFHTRDLESSDDVRGGGGGPAVNPTDFAEFLPWACAQLGVEAAIIIKKNIQADTHDHHQKGKGKKNKTGTKSHLSNTEQQEPIAKSESMEEEVDEALAVRILATFNTDENLTHIKFHRTRNIPREVLYLFGLAIKFYPHLYGITINSGVNKYTINELCKFLPVSNITELCFDNSFCKEANYDVLLDYCRNLTMLSLSRCRLNDTVVKNIVDKLEYQRPASLTLSILNLSCNQLTDKSAKLLAKLLRTNRRLNYLNLASNSITDEGAKAIFDVLSPFPFTIEEIMQNKKRYLVWVKEREGTINKMVAQYQAVDAQMKMKKKSIAVKTTGQPTVNKLAQAMILRGMNPQDPFDKLQKGIYKTKAEDLAKSRMGSYNDPVSTDTFIVNEWMYSNGNNTLAYLNIAYNNITYVTLNSIVNVLKHQHALSRSPKGLVNVCLEGNPLPECSELAEIDYFLDQRLRDPRKASLGQGKKKSNLKLASPKPGEPAGSRKGK